ncbi:hypothetical protein UNDYM_5943 (plasmid) [Undibacterium sp. YM2]|nr:hypothetical protein UNDYM_5943 [Undibacterium sp. YM2]
MTPDGEFSCTCEPGGGIRLWLRDGHFVRDDRVLLPGIGIRALAMGLDACYSEGMDPVYVLCHTEHPNTIQLHRLTDEGWVQQGLPSSIDYLLHNAQAIKSLAFSSQVFGAMLMTLSNEVIHLRTQGYRLNNSYATTEFAMAEMGFRSEAEAVGLALATYPPAADGAPPIKYQGLQAAVITLDGIEFYDYRLDPNWDWTKGLRPRRREWYKNQHFIPLLEGGVGVPTYSPDGNHLFVNARHGRGVLHFQRDPSSGNLQRSGHVASDLSGVLGVAACEFNDRLQIRIATETMFKLFERDEAGNWSELG